MNALLNERGPALWKLIDAIIDSFVPSACRRRPLDVVFVGVGGGADFANLIADQWARRYHHLLKGQTSMGCFVRAERDSMTKHLVLGRQQSVLIPGKRIVIIDDVLASGATMAELCGLVLQHKGAVVKAIALFNRGKSANPRVKMGSRRIQVASVCYRHMPTYPRGSCPSCRRKIPWSKETSAGLVAFHIGL
jgi:adenine/guanine phosphoribosyltransferase-like PRPP-binding protein